MTINTKDLVLLVAGVLTGHFLAVYLRNSKDKKNALTVTQLGDENYVFSQKYKDCEAKVNSQMAVSKYAGTVDLVALKKSMIEECMKSTT